MTADVVELEADKTISGGDEAQQLKLKLQDSLVGPETIVDDID